MKKSIKIVSIIRQVNNMLSLPTISQDSKSTISCFLESILHETGNYEGFTYNFRWPQPEDVGYKAKLVEAKSKEFNRNYIINSKLMAVSNQYVSNGERIQTMQGVQLK